MLSQIERSILKKISESELITKPELKKFLDKGANAGRDTTFLVDNVTKRLLEQRLISTISPVGSTCYLITQKGNQLLKEIEA